MEKTLASVITLSLSLSLAACAGGEEKEAPVEKATDTETSAEVMQWPDLLTREQPQPDATVRYGDDPLQLVDIWKPKGAGPHPAVIMIHGGCWQTEIAERDIMNWIADDMRRSGVGVWNIEYRGVDRDGGGYPGTYQDVAAAADMFADEAQSHDFRTDKIIAIGHSAGGHLALWLGNRPAMPAGPLRGDTPIKIDVAISQGGLPDLREGMKREGHPCGTDAPAQMSRGEFALTSPPEMTRGPARQVLFNNERDHVTPPEYGRRYIEMIRGKDVSMFVGENQGHVELIAPDSESWGKQRAYILRELGLK